MHRKESRRTGIVLADRREARQGIGEVAVWCALREIEEEIGVKLGLGRYPAAGHGVGAGVSGELAKGEGAD